MNGINILEKLESNGFEAYIVGGYVRDFLLGINSSDIDICTNARVKDILAIFNDVRAYSDNYGNVKLATNKGIVDITTYRKDIYFNGNRKMVEILYVDNLVEDIKRRDFTVNTLCMNKEGKIIDLLGALKDINDKIIRTVKDARVSITEDPLRMLRAVRFATTLDFQIDEYLYDMMLKNSSCLKELSYERVKDELGKILLSNKALKGLKLLKELNFLQYIGIKFDKVVYVNDLCGMYSQMEIDKSFPLTNNEKNNIKRIKEILKYGKIDKRVLFDFGPYLSMVAGEILGVNKDEVIQIYNGLIIKDKKDLCIKSRDICDILEIKPSKIIGDVFNYLIDEIISGRLANEKEILTSYVSLNREKWVE